MPSPPGLDEFLKSFNLAIDSGLVIDPRLPYKGNPSIVFAPTSAAVKHPIVDPLGPTRLVLLPIAAPIHLLGQATRGRRTDRAGGFEPGAGADIANVQIFVGRKQSQDAAVAS